MLPFDTLDDVELSDTASIADVYEAVLGAAMEQDDVVGCCMTGAITPSYQYQVGNHKWGEKVVAVIVPKGDPPAAAEIRQHVRDRLRSSRVPEHVVFVDELPWNETGKLLRRVLRETHAELGDDPGDLGHRAGFQVRGDLHEQRRRPAAHLAGRPLHGLEDRSELRDRLKVPQPGRVRRADVDHHVVGVPSEPPRARRGQ